MIEETLKRRESTRLAIRTRNQLGYVPELDGVRGIAILFVLGNHVPLGRLDHYCREVLPVLISSLS